MIKRLFYLFISISVSIISASLATAQSATAPPIKWQKTVGGTDVDTLTAMCISTDASSFILCGASKSNQSGRKSENRIGGYDYWVVKMDVAGNVLWNKTYGGTKNDIPGAIIALSDGGYLVGGTSLSDKSGSKSANAYGKSKDYWIIKLDANGNKVWDKTYGGQFTETLTSMVELSSGKYVLGGYSYSNRKGETIKKSDNLGTPNTADYWMLVIDKNGKLLNQNIYGATSMDDMTCMAAVSANSVYMGGFSYSVKLSGHKTTAPVGNDDVWMVRSDINGNIQFQAGFGGSRSDFATCMQYFTDKSFVIGGYSNSPADGNKSGSFLGVTDFYLIRTTASGNKLWDKSIGGTGGDYMTSVQQTKDGGFILGGYSNSDKGNNKSDNSRGGYDYWIVKTDKNGNVLWNKTIGGKGDDKLTGIYEISAGEFIVAGTSGSTISGEKKSPTVGNSGAADYWVMRLGNSTAADKTAEPFIASLSTMQSLTITPNPVQNTATIKYSSQTNTDVTVYSTKGDAILKAALPSASVGTHSFDMSPFAKGTYYIVMRTGDGNKITKAFIKE